jgi:hypothetical protein
VLWTISGSTGAQDVFTAHRGFDLARRPQSEALDVEPMPHSAHTGPGFAAKMGMLDSETRLRLMVLACSLGALVICLLVLRYGLTRDSDSELPIGEHGPKLTELAHALVAALFGVGVVFAVLALTAVPLGGMQRYLDLMRGRLIAIEHAIEHLGERVDRGRRAVLGLDVPGPGSSGESPATRRLAELGHTSRATGLVAATANGPVTVDISPRHRWHVWEPQQTRSTPPAQPRDELGMARARRPTAPPRPRAPDQPAQSRLAGKQPGSRYEADWNMHGGDQRRSQGERRRRTKWDDAATPGRSDSTDGRSDVFEARGRSGSSPGQLPERFDGLASDLLASRERAERPDRTGRPEQLEVPGKLEKPERIEKSDKPEKVERVEKLDKVDKPEKIEKIERVARIEKPERVQKLEKPEKLHKVSKPERIERPERRAR